MKYIKLFENNKFEIGDFVVSHDGNIHLITNIIRDEYIGVFDVPKNTIRFDFDFEYLTQDKYDFVKNSPIQIGDFVQDKSDINKNIYFIVTSMSYSYRQGAVFIKYPDGRTHGWYKIPDLIKLEDYEVNALKYNL